MQTNITKRKTIINGLLSSPGWEIFADIKESEKSIQQVLKDLSSDTTSFVSRTVKKVAHVSNCCSFKIYKRQARLDKPG